jgi:hypothetical protein
MQCRNQSLVCKPYSLSLGSTMSIVSANSLYFFILLFMMCIHRYTVFFNLMISTNAIPGRDHHHFRFSWPISVIWQLVTDSQMVRQQHPSCHRVGPFVYSSQVLTVSCSWSARLINREQVPVFKMSHLLGAVRSTSTPSTSCGTEVSRAKQVGSVRFHVKGRLWPHRADGQIVL